MSERLITCKRELAEKEREKWCNGKKKGRTENEMQRILQDCVVRCAEKNRAEEEETAQGTLELGEVRKMVVSLADDWTELGASAASEESQGRSEPRKRKFGKRWKLGRGLFQRC